MKKIIDTKKLKLKLKEYNYSEYDITAFLNVIDEVRE